MRKWRPPEWQTYPMSSKRSRMPSLPILYPAGSSQSSIVGALCRVYRGWPNSATLNADLSAGAVNITVVTDNDSGRTTTRYLPEWQTTSSQPGVTVSATGQTITISGSPCRRRRRRCDDRRSSLCLPHSGRQITPDLVASNLEQLIQADRIGDVYRDHHYRTRARHR